VPLSIFVHDLPQALRDIARATEGGADMVELRIDRLTEAAAVDFHTLCMVR